MSDSSHHHHAADGGHSREIRVGMITVYMLMSVIFLGGTFYVMRSLFTIVTEEEMQRKVLTVPSAQLLELRKTEDAALSAYRIVDRDKGRYGIPVGEAMKLVARDYASRKAAPAPQAPELSPAPPSEPGSGQVAPGAPGTAPGADTGAAPGTPAGAAPGTQGGATPGGPGGSGSEGGAK